LSRAASRLAVWQQTAAFYLEVARLPVLLFDGIVSGLPRRSKLDAEDTRGFVFGDFARDPEQLARQGTDFHDAVCVGFGDDVHHRPGYRVVAIFAGLITFSIGRMLYSKGTCMR